MGCNEDETRLLIGAHDRTMGSIFDSVWMKALAPMSETSIRETFEYVNLQLTYQQYWEILSEASERPDTDYHSSEKDTTTYHIYLTPARHGVLERARSSTTHAHEQEQ